MRLRITTRGSSEPRSDRRRHEKASLREHEPEGILRRENRMHVVALVGSLRRRSYNRMTYDAAVFLAPGGLTFAEADIGSLPLYDDDVRVQQGYPPAAARLRERIAAADAVLIISPEYNYSMPGVLKNAIDWASRAPDQPFKGKPVAIMGASTGRFGTVRMQHHLRPVSYSHLTLPTLYS